MGSTGDHGLTFGQRDGTPRRGQRKHGLPQFRRIYPTR